MSKQLSKTDYFLSFVFILMLVCIIAAFFYGVKIGKDSTEQRFEHLMQQSQELPEELTSYDQKYLVSFYHTAFLPFRDFKKKWLEHLETIELRSHTADSEALLKELGKLADSIYEEIEVLAVPATSPKLNEAHANYLKSLKLFGEAMDQSELTRQSGNELVNALHDNEFVKEAIDYALTAQENFFESIKLWYEITYPEQSAWTWNEDRTISIDEWESMQFNSKNYVVSAYLNEKQIFNAFLPQDVTANIDLIINNGQLEKMGLHSISETVDTLIYTNAVRQGDYIHQKMRYYQNAIMPQLPFFEEI